MNQSFGKGIKHLLVEFQVIALHNGMCLPDTELKNRVLQFLWTWFKWSLNVLQITQRCPAEDLNALRGSFITQYDASSTLPV